MCPIPRRRRPARFTSGPLSWRLQTRKASRSARKAFGMTHLSGGGNPAALLFGGLGDQSYRGFPHRYQGKDPVPRGRVKACKKPDVWGFLADLVAGRLLCNSRSKLILRSSPGARAHFVPLETPE